MSEFSFFNFSTATHHKAWLPWSLLLSQKDVLFQEPALLRPSRPLDRYCSFQTTYFTRLGTERFAFYRHERPAFQEPALLRPSRPFDRYCSFETTYFTRLGAERFAFDRRHRNPLTCVCFSTLKWYYIFSLRFTFYCFVAIFSKSEILFLKRSLDECLSLPARSPVQVVTTQNVARLR